MGSGEKAWSPVVLVSFPSTGGRAAAWAAARRRSLRWCRSPVSVDRRAAVADRGRGVVSGETVKMDRGRRRRRVGISLCLVDVALRSRALG